MRAGEGGVAAQSDLHRGREPAQAPTVLFPVQKRRLGEIHFPGDLLHPLLLRRRGQQTDRRGIAAERPVGKGIHLIDREAHGQNNDQTAFRQYPTPKKLHSHRVMKTSGSNHSERV